MDQNKCDKYSHMLKNSREKGHTDVYVGDKDIKVLGNNYRSPFKRKVSEAIFIKHLKPSFNVKEQSIWLLVYN